MREKMKSARGFALSMVLVILLLGGALVAVTYTVVNNLVVSSRNVVDKVELYNAAVEGVEKGKVWIKETMVSDGQLPRWEADNEFGELKASDLLEFDPQHPEKTYEILLVKNLEGKSTIDYEVGSYDYEPNKNIQVEVLIYDMDYRVDTGSPVSDDWVGGFPPRLEYSYEVAMSMHQGSSYAGSNRGEGSTGGGGNVSLGFYLIRSTATFEDKSEAVEQAMVVRL